MHRITRNSKSKYRRVSPSTVEYAVHRFGDRYRPWSKHVLTPWVAPIVINDESQVELVITSTNYGFLRASRHPTNRCQTYTRQLLWVTNIYKYYRTIWKLDIFKHTKLTVEKSKYKERCGQWDQSKLLWGTVGLCLTGFNVLVYAYVD